MARTSASDQEPREPLHLVVIGGGIAGCAAAAMAVDEDNVCVTLINAGLPLGGTCVNVGCLASRRLMEAARLLHQSTHNPMSGLEFTGKVTDFKAIMDDKRRFLATVQREEYEAYFKGLNNLEIITGHARLQNGHTVVVGKRTLEADAIILATGTYDHPLSIGGIKTTGYLTGESVLDLDEIPSSLVFVGATEIGLVCAQIFARFGARVTLLEPGDTILDGVYGEELESQLAGYLREEGVTILTGVEPGEVSRHREGIELDYRVGSKKETVRAEHLVMTMPRRARTDNLGLEEIGLQLDQRGFIEVDETQQTNIPGVYAAGDVVGRTYHAHMAAHEGGLAAHNAVSHSRTAGHNPAAPLVVYTDPQAASVGWDEVQARARGFDADARTVPLSQVPSAVALHQTRGFITLVRDRRSDHIIG
ncbi:MAG: dihydrolipoyl dehydrogenase family protein, partial [Bradymonadaceae bacterium]